MTKEESNMTEEDDGFLLRDASGNIHNVSEGRPVAYLFRGDPRVVVATEDRDGKREAFILAFGQSYALSLAIDACGGRVIPAGARTVEAVLKEHSS
jgi:hypothetical protein